MFGENLLIFLGGRVEPYSAWVRCNKALFLGRLLRKGEGMADRGGQGSAGQAWGGGADVADRRDAV